MERGVEGAGWNAAFLRGDGSRRGGWLCRYVCCILLSIAGLMVLVVGEGLSFGGEGLDRGLAEEGDGLVAGWCVEGEAGPEEVGDLGGEEELGSLLVVSSRDWIVARFLIG